MGTLRDTGLYTIKSDDLSEKLNTIVLGGEYEGFTAYYFLHGVCGIFALALHDRYGYGIWCLDGVDEDVDEGEDPLVFLIHIYCIAPNGQMVDVRGATDDEDALIEEFLDLCDKDAINGRSISAEELRNFIKPSMSEAEYSFFYNAALEIITSHESWYKYKVN